MIASHRDDVAICFLTILTLVVQIVYGSSESVENPSLSYWEKVLPGVDMPESVRKALSPLTASSVAFYGQQVSEDGLQSLAGKPGTNSFCDAAHIMCGEKAAAHFFPCPSCKDYRRRRRLFQIRTCEELYPLGAAGRPGEYFRAEILSAGQKLATFGELEDDPSIQDKAFLPRELMHMLPLDPSQLHLILATLSIPESSDMATGMLFTVNICSSPSKEGITDRACISTVEDMADFIHAHIDASKKASVLTFAQSTPAISGKPVKVLKATLVSPSSAKHVSCHRFVYPYQVYLCHGLSDTSASVYSVSLQAMDGTVFDVGAACHADTSKFVASHPAFVALNLKPGEGEVCHWLLSNSLVFTQS